MYSCDQNKQSQWGCIEATMGGSSKRSPFHIYDTDYENYDIYYACDDYLLFRQESFSVSARTPKISPEVFEKVKAVVAEKLP